MTVMIAIEAPDGQSTTVPVRGPGGVERLAFGAPGHRSAVWRFWANKNASCVYVATRTIAGVQKYSLHQSGDWRHAWVSAEAALRHTGSPDRVIDRWRRPAAVARGWTPALSIWVPHNELSDIIGVDRAADGVDFLPEPKPGTVAGLRVMIVQPGLGTVNLERAVPVCGFLLANGEVMVVVVTAVDLTTEIAGRIDAERARIAHARARILASGAAAPRIALFGSVDSGERWVYDLDARRISGHTSPG
jgi:hypothetical protein